MARAGIDVEQVVACSGIGHGAAVERLLAAVAADGSYRTVQVTADRVQFARTFRPTWAIVAGIATIWIALLGVLFFFVSTTETLVATVESDHTGTRVRLSGKITAAALGRIQSAMQAEDHAGGAGAPAMSIGRPVESAFDVTPSVSPPRSDLAATEPPLPTLLTNGPGMPAAVSAAPPVPVRSPMLTAAPTTPERDADDGAQELPAASLQLDDGRVVPVADRVEIGRDPAGSSGVAVDDEQRSVSKTHLAVQRHDGAWWVTDLHSTNGVTIIDLGGASVTLPAGRATVVDPGVIVKFGGRHLVLGPVGGPTP